MRTPPDLDPAEPWVAQQVAELAALEPTQAAAWGRLLQLADRAKAGQPSRRWLARVDAALGELEAPAQRLSGWFARVGRPTSAVRLDPAGFPLEPTVPAAASARVLKGLAWASARLPAEVMAGPLGDLAAVCFRKVSDRGARAQAVGNACVWALGALGTPAALAQLVRIKQRVRDRRALRRLAAVLAAAAAAAGVTAAELEDMSVPTCGLPAIGQAAELPLGEHTAVLAAVDGRASLTWRTATGAVRKSTPAAVRRDRPEALAALKRQAKELTALLRAQRLRLDRAVGSPRTWAPDPWRARILDHPLVGGLARLLIWDLQVDDGWRAAVWHQGDLRDLTGAPVDLAAVAQVRPWHPVRAAEGEAVAWRARLEELGLTQPFKQAHRETYHPSETEREGRLNRTSRFAGWTVRQHQLRALARERGWLMDLFGAYAEGSEPVLDLPEWGVRARLELAPTDATHPPEGDGLSDAGFALVLTLGAVRFDQALADVPPVAYSEVLRDVDLFVSVAGVGHDPSWARRAGDAACEGASFGELTEIGRTRREVVRRLVPRLSFGGRCQVTERFLVVQGELRTYKVHLGSGQVLVEPGDVFLPLERAQARSPREELALPFEGDATLSVVLARARLLADDRAIRDPGLLDLIHG